MKTFANRLLFQPRCYCLWWCLLLAFTGSLSVSATSLDWAINEASNGQAIYVISGDNYYKLNRYRREEESGRVSDLFPGLPSGIQAATWWLGRDKYYFFKDGKYYTADIDGSVSGPFEGSTLGDIFTRPIEAASGHGGKTYFFQNSHLYEYEGDEFKRDIDAGRYGLTGTMDAALSVKKTMFVFQGDMTRMVTPHSSGITVTSTPISMSIYLTSIQPGQ